MVTIKPRLRELLKERGLTQGQLSEMTGLPHSIKLGGLFYIKKT
ncbi:transcriptional regulator with XRE-family HTH domain [Priestia aryabhattai]|jgi:transcriptional regulator with XRE-family HTH domain